MRAKNRLRTSSFFRTWRHSNSSFTRAGTANRTIRATAIATTVPGMRCSRGGSGYAQGALYDMWVYKYGLYDPPDIKNQAKSAAMSVLQVTFCSTPTHSNPLAQAVVNELLN